MFSFAISSNGVRADIYKPAPFLTDLLSAIKDNLPETFQVGEITCEKKDVVILQNVAASAPMFLLGVRNWSLRASFTIEGQRYIPLLVQFPAGNHIKLVSELDDSEYQAIIVASLDGNLKLQSKLLALNLRTQRKQMSDQAAVHAEQMPSPSDAPVTLTGDMFAEWVTQMPLFFKYPLHLECIDSLISKINNTPRGDINTIFYMLSDTLKPLFELYHQTGDRKMLQECLDVHTSFFLSKVKDKLLQFAEACYQRDIKIVPVDCADTTQTDPNVRGRGDNILKHTTYMAKNIHKYYREHQNETCIGLLGAPHFKVAQLLNKPSIFLSPDINASNLVETVIAPQFQRSYDKHQVAGFITEHSRNFSKTVTVKQRNNSTYQQYLCCGLFAGVAVATAIAANYIQQSMTMQNK